MNIFHFVLAIKEIMHILSKCLEDFFLVGESLPHSAAVLGMKGLQVPLRHSTTQKSQLSVLKSQIANCYAPRSVGVSAHGILLEVLGSRYQ